MRRIVLVAIAAALVASPAGPAQAKGPTEVTVQGPGVDATLSYDDRSAEVELWTLMRAAQADELFGTGRLEERPPLTREQLGPRYVLTWGQLSTPVGVQHAYPFAEGGPWVKVPSAQTIGEHRVPAGWISPRRSLTRKLVLLGALRPSDESAPTAVSRSPEPAVAASESDSEPPWALLGAAGAALLAMGASAVRRRAS